MVSSVCGGNQVKSTKTEVCLAYSQAWWWGCHGLGLHECCWHGELWFTERTMNADMYCDILSRVWSPPFRKLGRRAAFQHENDPKHTFRKITALLKKLRVNVMDWPSMSPYLNPILWAFMVHPQMEGGGAQGLQHPPAPWCCNGLVEGDSSGNLWSSGELWQPHKILILWAQFGHFHFRMYSLLLPVVQTLMAVCWVILRGQ